MIRINNNQEVTEITLTPNRSLTTKQTQWVVFGVCTVVFIIALFWSIQGAFLVLPFAGLDIILFAYFMFKINRDSLRKELITIDSQKVLIQSGKSDIENALTFSRHDTYVVVAEQQDKKPLGLKFSDSKSYFELGSFLTNSDKVEVRKALKLAGLSEMNEQW
ncbi:MAG: putative membrane protein [Cocleimonas sp.]|jgi:uncharacterized membrane protein